MDRNQLSLRQRMAITAVKGLQGIAKRKAYKQMTKISEKHREFIDEIQSRCADIIELEPENKQGQIVATVCANIIQGFDTKQEMDIVIEMIKTAINKYWETEGIPQKEEDTQN